MLILTDKINESHKNVQTLVSKKNAILQNIEKINIEMSLAQKNGFEVLVEICTLGLISFSSKYDSITLDLEKKIETLRKDIINLDNELKKLQSDIANLEKEFLIKIDEFKEYLLRFQSKLVLLSRYQYINYYTQVELLEELNLLILNKDKFLSHPNIAKFITELASFIKDSALWIGKSNELFIKSEKIKEKDFFDTVESKPLTEKQIEAVLTNENNNLVLAGAGSGKTSVVVAKVLYMIKKNLLDPSQILILAFNRNAQEELKERFERKNVNVEIKTFHSFGLSIIANSSGQQYDICSISESSNNMTVFITNTIRELVKTTGIFFESFLEFIAYFKIPYKDEKEFTNQGEYYEYLKNYDMKTLEHEVETRGQNNAENMTTLRQETVKSYQELIIANYLTLNGVKYLYEEPYQYITYTPQHRQYKPDFYLPEYDIYIEHFGIDKNNNTAPYIDRTKYIEDMGWKRNLHTENETTLVETYSYEFTENTLKPLLKEKLSKLGVVFKQPSKEEFFEIINKQVKDSEFVKLFTTFLSHFKSNMHSIDELKRKANKLERTGLFLKLFELIFNEYTKFQIKNNCIDFNDMIVKAVEIIESGKYKHKYKHIFIDEFQDISTTRARLITKLLPLNQTSTTAVGDDWQSINKFAGSNIKIIQEFQKNFGISQTVKLDYTFRFNNVVSKIASIFVQKNPNQLQKEIKTITNQVDNKFSLLSYWTTGDVKKDLEYILKRISKKEKENKVKIIVLARYKFLLKDIKVDNNDYANCNISFSTVHGSKGNEADYIIILGIDNGKYGFPSKIEDDPILDIVVPAGDDFEDAEERRLFYVALTRTKGSIFLLSDRCNKSIFMDELIKEWKDEIFFLNDEKIEMMSCPECKKGYLKKQQQAQNQERHFYGCSNFPRCKYTENVQYCPDCNSEIRKNIEKKIAKCTNEQCIFETALCALCNGYMIERNGQFGAFLGCSNYPTCKHTQRA